MSTPASRARRLLSPGSVTRMMMRSASTRSTIPARVLTTTAPESRAAMASMPVPTMGGSATSSGTAWRCMLEPIRARLASSCSRNGIRAAATLTNCLGETSMKLTSSRAERMKLPPLRASTWSSTIWPFSSSRMEDWAMTYFSSSQAVM